MKFQQSSYTIQEQAVSVEICLGIMAGGVDSEKTAGVELGASVTDGTALQGIKCYWLRVHMIHANMYTVN